MEQQVAEAIEKVFNIEVNPHCVCPANEDPGEWAPNAEVIIYHTGNMPSIDHIEEWNKVSALLMKPPEWFYVEAINNEVSAVFNLQQGLSMLHEYYRVIQDLARYEFGNGIYTNPANDSQVFQVENLQLHMQAKFPDLKSAKQALKQIKETNERVL